MKVKLKILLIAVPVFTIGLIAWNYNKKMKITPEGGIVCERSWEIDEKDSIEMVQSRLLVSPNWNPTLKVKRITYLVSGYQNTPRANKQIDEFVCKVIDLDYSKYYQYDFEFYRLSIRMNNRKIKGDCGELYDSSNNRDFICAYTWFGGVFDSKVIKGKDNNDIHLYNFDCQ